MARFVRVVTTAGKEVYINPERIELIDSKVDDPGECGVTLGTERVTVQLSASQLAKAASDGDVVYPSPGNDDP